MSSKRNSRRSNETILALEPRRLLSTTPSFASLGNTAIGGVLVAISAGDFNNDGKPDLAVADQAGDSVRILLGSGNGVFSTGPVLAPGGQPTDVIATDLNGDGIADVLVATVSSTGANVVAFLSNGNGTFGAAQTIGLSTTSASTDVLRMAVGNFNTDAHIDLAVADYANDTVTVLLGNGDGTFTNSASYAVATAPDAISLGDFNADGHADIAVTGTQTVGGLPQAQITVYAGVGDGTFVIATQLSGGIASADTLAVADFTGDGTPDLLVGTGDSTTSLLANGGAFTFSDVQNVALPAAPLALAAADLNFDGSVDAVTANASASSISVLTNDGTGGLTAQTFGVGSQPAAIAVADLNDDGKPDLVVANAGSASISVLLNTTAGTVLQATTTTVTPSANPVDAGTNLMLTATVAASGTVLTTGTGMPTGTVSFYDGKKLLGTSTITAGTNTATFTTSTLIVGSHTITANYAGNTAFAASNSAALTQTVSATATQGPDLVATLLSPSLPSEIVPNQSYPVRLKITNQGNQPAIGALVNAFAIGDLSLSATGKVAGTTLNLKVGKSITLAGSIQVLSAGDSTAHTFTVAINSDSAIVETDSSNNTATSAAPVTVVNAFGQVGGRNNVALKVVGGAGTFRLTGPGEGTISSDGTGVSLVLTGTTAASRLTYAPAAGSSTVLASLTDSSPLGSINAAGLSVAGSLPGGTISLAGGVKQVVLGSVTGSALSIIGDVKQLSLAEVSDSSVTVSGALNSFIDRGAMTAGTLSAASVGTLRVTGSTIASTFTASGGDIRSIFLGLLDTQTQFIAATLPATARIDGQRIFTAGDSQFVVTG